MKSRLLLSLAVAVLASSLPAFAQKKDPNPKKWEAAQARMIQPEVRSFVTPQICDIQMLSKTRESYGPYYFPLSNSIDSNVTKGEIENDEKRAMYRACQEADADAIIEPLFDSYVYDKDTKTLVVELSGYPVKYTNFRPASKDEIQMIQVVYPQSTSVLVHADPNQVALPKQEGSTK